MMMRVKTENMENNSFGDTQMQTETNILYTCAWNDVKIVCWCWFYTYLFSSFGEAWRSAVRSHRSQKMSPF